jgi:hypothetical protein
MVAKPIASYVAPALLLLGALLAAGNWYVDPGRAAAWATVLLLLGGMTLALRAGPRRVKDEATRRHAADSIRSGILFAGAFVVVSLGATLATKLGIVSGPNVPYRATMALMGAFLVFSGNSIPKTLTPLWALECDPARVQAFRRVAGWTWVATGLSLAIAWLALPVPLAEALTFLLVPAAILITAGQLVRLRRTRQRAA